jgi:hypothetical protein
LRCEVICAEEYHLRKMFSLCSKKSKTAVNFLNEVQQLAEASCLDVDSFWLIVWCLMRMQPRVAAYVNFSKGPRQTLSWLELRKLTAEAEYNMEHSNISLVQVASGNDGKVPPLIPMKSDEVKVKQEKNERWQATATCHTCGEIGHISPSCPKKAAKPPVPQLLAANAPEFTVDEVDQQLRELCGLPVGGVA